MGLFFPNGSVNLHSSEPNGSQRESQVATLRWLLVLLRRFEREACCGETKHTTRAVTTRPDTQHCSTCGRQTLSVADRKAGSLTETKTRCSSFLLRMFMTLLAVQLDCNKKLRHACTCATARMAALDRTLAFRNVPVRRAKNNSALFNRGSQTRQTTAFYSSL